MKSQFLFAALSLATTGSANTSDAGYEYFLAEAGPFAGPTAEGDAPFLAATNPAPFGSRDAEPSREEILSLQSRGNLSPYFPNPTGFGVEEYPLPPGANITEVHVLHRHGARFPPASDVVETLGATIQAAVENGTVFTGKLDFLNSWTYKLGAETLVALGRKELYESGTQHYYNYGHLFDPAAPKLVARTTTQDRMFESAENFLAGFFGLDWRKHAKLGAIIESAGYNNSLMSMYTCPNSQGSHSLGGFNALEAWKQVYLRGTTSRLRKLVEGYNWTIDDTYNAQSLCAYETVALGYSEFCELFTLADWEGFNYGFDLAVVAIFGFLSPTGRAQGIAWVEEFLARVQYRPFDKAGTNANMTLNADPSSFPVNQTLYFDFTHDGDILAVLTAFGLKQFAEVLPREGPPPRHRFFITSHLVPFAARLDIEIIQTPRPVSAKRNALGQGKDVYERTGCTTQYVHFLLNQRTIPLGHSFPECGNRDDGWCELDTFLRIQKTSLGQARFDYACNGNYSVLPYGAITNGSPVN
ncbi:histidine phosphatase superfamily [Aspergillus pseudoustus]|uniref:3-phytase n=1 Tax=Aspergillus pseudoustus TaxID=1810923 RepID=A0ABR4JGV8_9EURO